MSAPDFKTLLEGATQGEWMRIPYEDIVFTKLNDGCCGVPIVQAARYKGPTFQGDLAYIARTNPAVMRVVWEALNDAKSYIMETGDEENMAPMIDDLERAISFLNGTTPTDKKDE